MNGLSFKKNPEREGGVGVFYENACSNVQNEPEKPSRVTN